MNLFTGSLRTWVLVFTSGLILGFSQPFFTEGIDLTQINSLGFLAFFGYVPLLLLIKDANLKRVFGLTFLATTIQYTVALFWIYIAVHVYGHVPALASALIALALPALMAFKAGVFFTVCRFLSQKFNISFLWLAPLTICALEYFKNFYIFGGFPWGNVGYSIGRIDEILQVASLVGVYGLVFFAASVNSLLALAWVKKRPAYAMIAVSLVALSFGYGSVRLSLGKNEFAPSVRVAMLQGNIPQEQKSDSRLYANDILAIYQGFQRKAKAEGAKLVIWPESSYPRMLEKNVKDLGFGDEEQVASIIGTTVYGEKPDGGYIAHNSALLLNNLGEVVRRYDKSHLVPFGEYVPWPFSGIVDKIVPGMGAFLPGTELSPEKLSLGLADQLVVGTTVCYEGIFPEITRAYAKQGASLLVNLTNDAWYGLSSAPYQHLLMYRLRSVESGLPFVRATNSGISAWIDTYGRLHEPTHLFEREMILADVPLIKKNTPYVFFGDIVAQICLSLLIFGYVLALVPIHRFIRERQWLNILIVLAFSLLVASFTLYFSSPKFITDESARTKILAIFAFSLLLMTGLLSKTARSRHILFASGTILILLSILFAIFESAYFLLGALLGLLIYLLAFRIKVKPTAQ